MPAEELAERTRAYVRGRLQRELNDDEARLVEEIVLRRFPAQGAIAAAGKRPVSAWILVAANLVPLAGVIFFGWPLVALLALFWMENVVIGVLNVARMLLADPRDPALWVGKVALVPFFCVHYGGFAAVHGIFVFFLFGGEKYRVEGFDLIGTLPRAIADFGLWLPVAVLVASHLFSFFWNYLYRGEFRRARLFVLMFTPYARVILLHVVIVVGGLLAQRLGSPVWALVLLVALKIALDLFAHVKEHSKA